jgi:hypothetical protein
MLRVATLSRALVAATLLLGATAGSAGAQVVVGGQPMLPSRTIVDNAVNSPTTPPWSRRSRRRAWSIR